MFSYLFYKWGICEYQAAQKIREQWSQYMSVSQFDSQTHSFSLCARLSPIIHSLLHTFIHIQYSHAHTFTESLIYTYITHSHTYILTQIHMYIHLCIHSYTQPHIHSHAHIHTVTYTHTHVYSHIHHTHITQLFWLLLLPLLRRKFTAVSENLSSAK